MPFAGFKDWEDCHAKMISKGYSKESADKICGKLKAKHEGKGNPKRDRSGKGIRANRGRGGCEPPQDKNKMQKLDFTLHRIGNVLNKQDFTEDIQKHAAYKLELNAAELRMILDVIEHSDAATEDPYFNQVLQSIIQKINGQMRTHAGSSENKSLYPELEESTVFISNYLEEEKEKGQGKGWFGESKRHSEASKKGKSKDMINGCDYNKEGICSNEENPNYNKKCPYENQDECPSSDFVEDNAFNDLEFKKKDLAYDVINTKKFTKITTDFNDQDFTVLNGPISREGEFDYLRNGEKITLYKDWDSLKNAAQNSKYALLKGSTEMGAHEAPIIGFAYNFIPREDLNPKQIYADVVTLNDLDTLTDLLNPPEGYEVSLGFPDEIEGNIQHVKGFDHVAMSLENKEMGRCRTGEGTPCVVKMKENHNQNLGGDSNVA